MKFCDNPECELHIDITEDGDKPIFIEKAERVINRHLCTTRNLKKIYLCDTCKNAMLMCIIKKARQGHGYVTSFRNLEGDGYPSQFKN